MKGIDMLRYTVLIITAMFAISSAASAQIIFSIGGSRNNGHCPPHQQSPYGHPAYNTGYVYNGVPPGHYYCNTHNSYCSHPPYSYGNNRNRGKNKRWKRNNSRHSRNNNHCPPGHYYCSHHRQYCSH